MGWLILAAYAVGWAVATFPVARWFLNDTSRGDQPDPGDRMFSLLIGGLVALLWPAVALLWLVSWPFRGWGRRYLTTDYERQQVAQQQAEAERRELEELRALAKEHGLAMPEVPRAD